MSKTLVIVESPAKAKSISKFLGSRYTVKASMGHLRDLPKSQLGVDLENDFEPKYIAIRGRGDLIKDLRAAAKGADKVFLASDPDREGKRLLGIFLICWDLTKVTKTGLSFMRLLNKLYSLQLNILVRSTKIGWMPSKPAGYWIA